MFKPGNPFQQLVNFTENNVFNNIDNSIELIENDVNKIIIDNIFLCHFDEKHDMFVTSCRNDIYYLIENINLNYKNVLEYRFNNEIEFCSDINMKTSIIFSIIYYMKNINDIDDILIDFINNVFYDCYENLVNNLKDYLTECYYDYTDPTKNYGPLNYLYYYIFTNNEHLNFILKNDKKILLKLLEYCYSNMSPNYVNKTMKILNFDDDMFDCIHDYTNNIKIENAEFKEYFNLE